MIDETRRLYGRRGTTTSRNELFACIFVSVLIFNDGCEAAVGRGLNDDLCELDDALTRGPFIG